MAERYRKLTLLHSNDIHADFMAEGDDEDGLGGISRLSGYVSKVRAEEDNVLYCIAGDMLQGSLIDTEYKGISTIEIMNTVAPDVACLGNHEIDYGLGHLLFLERCAKFPIVCANIFIKNPRTRLFASHKFLKVGGMRIMFIGLITHEVLASLRSDQLLSTLVDVEEAAREVGRICNAYRNIDVDFTVLLTHIGFEEDKQLAELLDPDWGVDVIIGGHSHTVLEQPEQVGDILIATAGHGTTSIGRFDIIVDTDLNNVESFEWQLVPLEGKDCPRDLQLEGTVARFRATVEEKYDFTLCRFKRPLTHPERYRESELGNLVADALREYLALDLMILGSGSIRRPEMGPVMTRGNLIEMLPFDDRIISLKVSGAQLRRMIAHTCRDEILDGGHGEYYQYSSGLCSVFNRSDQAFERFDFHGCPLDDDAVLRIGLQEFHYKNFDNFFPLTRTELVDGTGRSVATSCLDVLEEFFANSFQIDAEVEGRLTVI
ncbi:MAG: bifunctional metallophosphatase/5'-nucleotidase [Propionibacteriaceae bacterium]|jgi:5'-nucleotidase|nr:bifunctional metallophosphatase/5'-nucleotidase [Propionibacteriaceae bacterium]